ncbi:MAG: hypothetical protein U0795_26350 [Pirellulales bacterium]
MKMSCGVVLLLAGLAVAWYWFDRSFHHPTAEDRQRLALIADGLPEPLAPADGRKIYLYAAVALIATGTGMLEKLIPSDCIQRTN